MKFDKDGFTPAHRFSGSKAEFELNNYHTWGCPVFVLEAKAQSLGMPKWEPRSRVGIYLGHSPSHSGSVALVLNPRTLHVSPKFHVVFDNNFSTVPFMKSGEVPPNWENLVKNFSDSVTDHDYKLAEEWTELTYSKDFDSNDKIASEENIRKAVASPKQDPLLMPVLPDINELTLRRSPRLKELAMKNLASLTNLQTYFTYSVSNFSAFLSQLSLKDAYITSKQLCSTLFDGSINQFVPTSLASTLATNDVYTYGEMLRHPPKEKKKFIEAMQEEIAAHVKRNHWTVIPKSEIPPKTKSIMAIWAFKKKRNPFGKVQKYKARLCARGGHQIWGKNYWETFAPVVNWLSVRTMLEISIIHKLQTRSIDFTLAFPQADLLEEIFMLLPAGIEVQDKSQIYVLRLNKSLYGLKQSARNWFQCLSEALKLRGLKPTVRDPCVFIGKRIVVIVYVDDCLIFSPAGSKDTEYLIKSLQSGNENFVFSDQGDLQTYLGMDIESNRDSITLKQPHLIQRLLDLVEVNEKYNSKKIPALSTSLLSKGGNDRENKWNYRQAVGMMNYLAGTTRPDISMAVHQVARFSADPCLPHERAVKFIARYLLGNSDKGLIYKPDPSRGLECFVDADFAGAWDAEDKLNPENVLSRTGYVIMYAGCPVQWCSKLQHQLLVYPILVKRHYHQPISFIQDGMKGIINLMKTNTSSQKHLSVQ